MEQEELDGVWFVRDGLDKIKSMSDEKVLQKYRTQQEKWNIIRKINVGALVPELSLI